MEELRNKAEEHYKQSRHLESIKWAEQRLNYAEDLGDKKEEVAAYTTLAESYHSIGNYQKSIQCSEKVLNIAKEVEKKESIEGDEKVLNIAMEVERKEWEMQAHTILAKSYERVKSYEQSKKHCEKLLSIADYLKKSEVEMEAYRILALSSYFLQDSVENPDYKESIGYGELLLKTARKLGDRKREEEAYSILANSYRADKYLRLKKSALNDPSYLKTGSATAGGSPNYSSESPQDDEHEKELTERGLRERSDSGDFEETKEGETDEALGRLPNGSSVPSEIEPRGPGAKVSSENDLKTGKVRLYRARIILIGQDQAGKTSLKKVLFGLPFDPKEESTEEIKADPTVFEIDVKQVKNWQHSDDASEEPKEININEVPTRVTPELKDPHLSPEEVTDVLVQYLRGIHLQIDATSMENQTILDVWDFAGQHLYYAFYPVFLSPRAVYMLTYNLSKDLEAPAPPWARKAVFGNEIKNENNETNLENLLSWLTSISTLCYTEGGDESASKELDYLRPPIFIVGTHADKPHQDIDKMQEQIQKKTFGKKFSKHLIRPFFQVDNTQGSSGKKVADLRKRMKEILKKEPYMGEEVPVWWLKFEKIVQALVAEEVYYLKLKQVQTIIQKVCSIEDEKEVATLLDFYHNLGMIVKHRNTVVLQAQWLIAVFKQLITVPNFNDMKPVHETQWKALQDKGVLSMELVDHVFDVLGDIREDILDMMEQFGLIAKFATSPTVYFVPCQLKTPPHQVLTMEPSPSDPFPLYLCLELGFVPHSFFSQLVSEFTRSWSKSGFSERFTMSPEFYDGLSKFVMKKSINKHQLVMLCKHGSIKIVLKQVKSDCFKPSAEIEKLANAVRKSLENAMHSLTSRLPWLKNLKSDWCAACPSCQSLLKIVVKEGQLEDCNNCYSDETLTLPELEKWFSRKEPPTTRASLPLIENQAITTSRRPSTAPLTIPSPSTGTSLQPAPGDRYKMTANPTGITLIINNIKFADLPEQQRQQQERPRTRHGTEKDVSQVKKLFTSLGFTVNTIENISTEELKKVLDSVAHEDHSQYDCFVLWLMSHGKSGEVFCSDSVTLPIQTAQDLLSNCDTLKGKPKLFFIQACRGKGEDAVEGSVDSTVSRTDAARPPATAGCFPKYADFLFSYSSVNDYASYRNTEKGSYYVRGVVEAFNERVGLNHLVDILTLANKKVSKMIAISENTKKPVKLIPEFSSSLRKEVWFNFKK